MRTAAARETHTFRTTDGWILSTTVESQTCRNTDTPPPPAKELPEADETVPEPIKVRAPSRCIRTSGYRR
ncbi:hypothetical protein GCM10010974_24610 [Brevibacterium sediminis]|uniref:Uncharacterized protein n=1 Tax=Brevibacterium sediminis TaxID=1857024 RepID=A0ABQ1MIE6_9MICO|nr:hypothetical protein GCM10010974_24610 [Brevibacterium sediminis]